MDFFMVTTRTTKKGVIEVYPKFIVRKSEELMIRGGDFYAVWVEEKGLWSTDEQDALRLIDRELDKYAEEYQGNTEDHVRVLHMWDAESGMIDAWHKYCQRQLRDSYVMLDEKIIFSNTAVNKLDYASKRLDYPLKAGDISAYDRLMSVLYLPDERRKIEWAIGAIVTGESKELQKFMVLYGAVGTGKSTVINIIEKLFAGYFAVFDAKSLGSSSSSFALEQFRSNPLVAIQHDGDLSHIEDNTRINSLVSHELMTVNEKFKSAYTNRFKCFLIMGTNKPVRITDAKSGLLRRLIDVTPSGRKLPREEYDNLTAQIPFELGAIAYHCREIYLAEPNLFDNYIPTLMMGASNDFYNFMEDSYYVFEKSDSTTLKAAWEMYKTYCEEAKVPYPMSLRPFKEELKNYFREFSERAKNDDGARARNVYTGFRKEKFDGTQDKPIEKKKEAESWLHFDCNESILDDILADCPAQYASEQGIPCMRWDDVKEKLCDISTDKLHYVKPPLEHIVVDFDIPDENGQKSLEMNSKAANGFPKTYAELSKSGAGIHLHYIYSGDVTKLAPKYAEHIEVKVFGGKSSLRRKVTKCNDIPVATISSGLPLKEEKNVVNKETVKSERSLRKLIERNLLKEIHPGTKPSVDFIVKILDDAYKSGLHYDISDMRGRILTFAAGSTNHADYCVKKLNEMKFKSDDILEPEKSGREGLVFYDVEVFQNLLLVNWKYEGEGKPVVRMINPTSEEIEQLVSHNLVGFNCRRYDNHILYARLMGYSNEQIYNLSQRIVSGDKNALFGEAYNFSYTDVYDFSSKKQSLKKFEIELGIHHQELGLPWDKPVPENLWEKVAQYCDNDVLATEAVFNARKADFTARQILADVAGMTVNDTTNSLTTRIIFGKNRTPQGSFNYRFMGCDDVSDDNFTVFDKEDRPIFPGYKFEGGKSTYRGEEVGEGGYVYAEPGMYENVALLDIASMHPSSIVAEKLFGDTYTQRFKEIMDARIAIKHKNFAAAKEMLGGKLAGYLDDESAAKDLAQALKIAINSVYGLSSAKFDNPFRDKRNIDNIVAKRGALFMINLKHEVQKRGFTVAHIKTDSIKIPNATDEIIEFVTEYGRKYGYNFEHEATYEKMCLVNDAVYIAKNGEKWTATGTQFQVPYVFKTLFSHEKLEFEDFCETKSVTSSAMYLDMGDDENHNYIFVGRVGSFCPMKSGGGKLLREKDGKFYAVTGTKGYNWLESEMVKTLGKEDDIDISYYTKLADSAVKAIEKYGDIDKFIDK